MTQKQTPAGSPRNLRSEVAALLRLGVPILLTQVGVVVVSFADTMMVGGYSTEALAAAAFVNNFFMVPMVMLMGFAAGLTPIIGSLYSRRRHSDVGRTLAAGLRLNVAAAVALMAIMGILFFFLDRRGQPAELLPLIRSYYLIVMASMLPAPFFNACQQTANAVTDTATPMWIILGANALNILGNWLLIYGHWGLPELGLDGAGISTFVARLAATGHNAGRYAFAPLFPVCRRTAPSRLAAADKTHPRHLAARNDAEWRRGADLGFRRGGMRMVRKD